MKKWSKVSGDWEDVVLSGYSSGLISLSDSNRLDKIVIIKDNDKVGIYQFDKIVKDINLSKLLKDDYFIEYLRSSFNESFENVLLDITDFKNFIYSNIGLFTFSKGNNALEVSFMGKYLFSYDS